jgi:DNA-binding beta-propeller fold protein YncE
MLRDSKSMDRGGKMRSKATVWFGMFLVVMAPVGLASAAANSPGYRLVTKITLGGEGGWDYFDVDPATGRVFIPRGDHILVVDSGGKQVADIGHVHGTHAIVFAPDLKRAFLSAEGSVDILDMEKMQALRGVDLAGKDPDAILYDASVRRVFTFNGGGTKDATAIDVETGKVVGSIPLGGKPETAQADGEGHIYVNVEDKNQIVAFDSKTLKILHTWHVAPCEDPSGLAIDVAHQRLFAGCRNQLMAVVDYTTGKVVATVPIGKGVDANRFDPGTGLAFASCGDGTITVAHQDSPDKYSLVQTIRTQRGARTMTLDTKNHNVYTVTAEFGPPPPATPELPHPWPTVISKTFTLLIFSL